ncbi:hypothetical protein CYMTET_7595 [Cymbomonas tetramitiformis]|uniref:Uncharacterized protein n=1 Tax=Cymbomonas tetramitiformis TaxID=36881 RepID=A0AAE0GV76_9CHLO|nr:hypothetical protein CYMTET_7595 [Cymbomonas tetramitiformis]
MVVLPSLDAPESPRETYLSSLDTCLLWEKYCKTSDFFVTHLSLCDAAASRKELKLLVLFSGTGSIEKRFLSCYPNSLVVTVDQDPHWQPTFAEKVQDWNFKRYAHSYFDVIWASPPCTEYSQVKTTGIRQLRQADACARWTLQIFDYLKPKHRFLENPMGRFLFALSVLFEVSWQHIIVMSSGALRRWERNRAGGWFLEDATQPKAVVASISTHAMNIRIDDEYRGIPYNGRKRSVTPVASDDESGDTVATEIVKAAEVEPDDEAWTPTPPPYSLTSHPSIRGEDDLDPDAISKEKTVVQPIDPSGPDTGLTSMGRKMPGWLKSRRGSP